MEIVAKTPQEISIPMSVELAENSPGYETADSTIGSEINPKTPSEKITRLLKPETRVLCCRQPNDALNNMIPQPTAKTSGMKPTTRANAMIPIPVNIVALVESDLSFMHFSKSCWV